ncbi:MAG: hypothetical protein V4656_02455 [Pseudomonadota bacterium]
MNRRGLFRAALACALAPATLRAQPQEAAPEIHEAEVAGLTQLFKDLMAAGEALGDAIDKAKLRRFLTNLQEPLIDLLEAKQQVAAYLRLTTCTPSPSEGLALARQADEEIQRLMVSLRDATRSLAVAIKPPALQARATALADNLVRLHGQKILWLNRVGRYCQPGTDRAAMQGEIAASTQILRTCRRQLSELIAGLG